MNQNLPISDPVNNLKGPDLMSETRARYFTGKPCTNGHVAERYVANDACVECNREAVRRYRAGRPKPAAKPRDDLAAKEVVIASLNYDPATGFFERKTKPRLGARDTPEKAAEAYTKAAAELRGEYARTE